MMKLAFRAEFDSWYISGLERAYRNLSLLMLELLALDLNITVCDLVSSHSETRAVKQVSMVQRKQKKVRLNSRLESEGAEFLVLGHLLMHGIAAYKAYNYMKGL